MGENLLKEKFESVEKYGEIDFSDFEEGSEALGPDEELELLAAVPVKRGKGKNLVLLTDRRLIFQKKGEFTLLGREKIEDFPYERITGINCETRKKYDLIKIRTKGGKEKEFMAPKQAGVKLVGMVRSLQEEKEGKERREEEKETPLTKIEKLSELKEKGAITEEEFEEKKEELLKEV